jgi:hypothetical protein
MKSSQVPFLPLGIAAVFVAAITFSLHGQFHQGDQQGPPFEQINEDTVVPLRSFNDNRFIFEEVEANADGLGPTYNRAAASAIRTS